MSRPTSRSESSPPAPVRILVVEDDAILRRGVATLLEREGFEAIPASDGEEAIARFSARDARCDLVILDLMLPGADGLTVLRALRHQRPEVPVLVLSAKGTVMDKVTLLDAGADDYVVKPFEVEELLARVRALLGRFRRSETRRHSFGAIEIDLDLREARRNGEPVALSPTELAILEALLHRPGRTLSRQAIVDRVWGLDPPETERAVDYHILQLRRKLEDDPAAPRWIVTVRGLGYRMGLER